MKKHIISMITIIATSAVVFLLISVALPPARTAAPVSAAAAGQAAAQAGCDSTRSVQVSGTAVINVAPDRTLIQLGVQSNGATTKQVEALNTDATQAVIQAIRGLGVESKDIATDWYGIEPVYDNYDSLVIKGYRINNVIAVTVRDVSKTGSVIAAALNAGANQVVNVEFYTSELRKYRDQARDLAVQAAREKAQALASAAGAQTGCVLTINENSWSSYNGWWYGRGQNRSLWTQNVMQNAAPSGGEGDSNLGEGGEPLSLGMISVNAEIHVSFGLQ